MFVACFLCREGGGATFYIGLVLGLKHRITQKHPHILHNRTNRQMQKNLRNLRGHAKLKNPIKILQIIHKPVRLQTHPLPPQQVENRTRIKQPDGGHVHTRYAPKRSIKNFVGEMVP